MPELPEVENVVQFLQKTILGRRILRVELFYPKIRYAFPKELGCKVQGASIVQVTRCGKYILVQLDNGYTLIAHLGMSGIIYITPGFVQAKYTRYVFQLDYDSHLRYDDHRGFGMLDLVLSKNLEHYTAIAKIGPEPFSSLCNEDYLWQIAQRRSCNIKSFLLNQEIIAGIGNIYACELMYYLKINPFTPVNKLSKSFFRELIVKACGILQLAIQYGGTTIDFTYQHPDGKKGEFVNLLLVYNNENKLCLECNSKIVRVKQSGRSTYYCPVCQS